MKLLIELKDKNESQYYLDDNVKRDMVDERILKIRDFLLFKFYTSKI